MRVRLPEIIVHDRLAPLALSEKTPWHIAELRIPEAWRQSRGAGVRVGVIDTGVDSRHVEDGDLTGRVLATRDFSRSQSGWDDPHGHGTHVAGIIAAAAGNGKRVMGVAPEAQLLIAKALGDDGGGDDRAVAAAIDWLLEREAAVINLSLGAPRESALLTAAVERAVRAGAHVVCAAGNQGGRGVSWPAMHARTISVGAVDRHLRPAAFSSPSQVNIAAPGVEILSTYRRGGYAELSGTSMAAPFVAAALALRIALEQRLGGVTPPERMIGALEEAALDVGPPGRDTQTGAGLVRVADLLRVERAAPAGVTVFIPGGVVV